jgi:lysophospholipase L1-like esterase
MKKILYTLAVLLLMAVPAQSAQITLYEATADLSAGVFGNDFHDTMFDNWINQGLMNTELFDFKDAVGTPTFVAFDPDQFNETGDGLTEETPKVITIEPSILGSGSGSIDEATSTVYSDSLGSPGDILWDDTKVYLRNNTGWRTLAILADDLDPTPIPLSVTSITVGTLGLTADILFNEDAFVGTGGSGGWSMDCEGRSVAMTLGGGTGNTRSYNLSETPYLNEDCVVDYIQPGDGLENGVGTDLASFSGFIVDNQSLEETVFAMTLNITDISATGDTFAVNGSSFNYLDSPATISGLSSSTEAVAYTGTNIASCTGASVTGAGPWEVDMSASDETVDCTITEVSGANLVTVRPTGDGDVSNPFTKSSGTTSWELVDEETLAIADYVQSPSNTAGEYIYFTFPAQTIPAGATNIVVKLMFNADDAGGANNARAALKVGDTRYGLVDPGVDLFNFFYDYEYIFAVNPATGTAWTVDDVNSTGVNPLQQFGINSTDASPSIYLAQIYLEISYDVEVASSLPTTNIYAHWLADSGITSTDSKISAWEDQINGFDAIQSDEASKPVVAVDTSLVPVVAFSYSTIPNGVTTRFLDLPVDFTVPVSDSTVWVVTAGGISSDRTPFSLGDSPYGWTLADTITGTGYHVPSFENDISNLAMLPVNKSIVSRHAANAGEGFCIDAATISNNLGSPYSNGLTKTGGSIGRNQRDNDEWTNSNIYEIIVYTPAQSTEAIATTREYLKTKYNIKADGPTTEYVDGQIITEGDSITAGIGAVANMAYPLQLAENNPTWKVTSVGTSGAMVSTLVGRISNVNTLFDDTKYSRNVLMVHIGTNNMAGGSDNGADVYAELVAYVQSMVSAGWEVWVATIVQDSSNITSTNTYNSLIRSNIVADGATKLIDINADPIFDAGSATDTTYYTDGTHLTAIGYGEMARIISTEGEM